MHYLGIDLGGTNIAVGIVDEDCKIVAKVSSSTATENAEQVADAMAATQAFSSNVTMFNTMKTVVTDALQIGK